MFTLGSHHQKTFVAIGKRPDGKRAIHGYCAGIDFSTGPAGYGAGVYHGGSWWHDAALRVHGANAIGLLRNFVTRWNHDLATFRDGKTLAHGVTASDDLAVGSLTDEVDMMTGSPGRVDTTPTIPLGGIDWLGVGETRETWVLESYRIWIERAAERIFIANQYVRHQEIADLLLAQLEKERGLRVTIVMPMYAEEVGKRADLVKLREAFARRGASEEERRALLATIREKALTIDPFNKLTLFVQARCLSSLVAHERVQVWMPRPTQGIPYIHAKMMLVDAQALLVGSANLNGRSLLGQADSELNLVLTDAAQVARIRDAHGWHREPASEVAPGYAGSWYAQHKLVRYSKEHWQVDEAYGAFPRGKDALIRYFEAIQLDGRMDVLKLDKARFVANVDALFAEMRRRFPLVDPETLDLGALMASAGAHLI